MRRRALLAASQPNGGNGGGEFYCEFWIFSPRNGYILYHTSTFIIDGDKTWEDVDGLFDVEERYKIQILRLPNGEKAVTAKSTWKGDGSNSYMPETSILVTDKININYTYKFISS